MLLTASFMLHLSSFIVCNSTLKGVGSNPHRKQLETHDTLSWAVGRHVRKVLVRALPLPPFSPATRGSQAFCQEF